MLESFYKELGFPVEGGEGWRGKQWNDLTGEEEFEAMDEMKRPPSFQPKIVSLPWGILHAPSVRA